MKLYFDEEGTLGIHPPSEDWIEYETPLNRRINLQKDIINSSINNEQEHCKQIVFQKQLFV